MIWLILVLAVLNLAVGFLAAWAYGPLVLRIPYWIRRPRHEAIDPVE